MPEEILSTREAKRYIDEAELELSSSGFDHPLADPSGPDEEPGTGMSTGFMADVSIHLPMPAVVASCLTLRVRQSGKEKIILRDLSVSINGGELVGVIGASGSGKSTFVQAISGIRSLSAGSVSLAGWDVRLLSAKLPLVIGYLPQSTGFHLELSVREIIGTAAALRLPRSVPRTVRENWAAHVVDVSGLDQLLDQPYRTLSGGQMRRMALAEALIGDPQFLILDELTYVVNYGWVPVDEVVDGITGRWPKTNVVVTGRNAPPEVVEIADTVTEMSVVKHAYQQGITAMKGIEY